MNYEDRYTQYEVTYRIEHSPRDLKAVVSIHNDEKGIKKALQKQIRIMWGFRQLAVTISKFDKLNDEVTA